jgi:hypothetical protein
LRQVWRFQSPWLWAGLPLSNFLWVTIAAVKTCYPVPLSHRNDEMKCHIFYAFCIHGHFDLPDHVCLRSFYGMQQVRDSTPPGSTNSHIWRIVLVFFQTRCLDLLLLAVTLDGPNSLSQPQLLLRSSHQDRTQLFEWLSCGSGANTKVTPSLFLDVWNGAEIRKQRRKSKFPLFEFRHRYSLMP